MKLYQIFIIGLVILIDFANSNAISNIDDGKLKCYVCDSGEDSDCESKPNAKSLIECADGKDSCISKFIEGKTSRACGNGQDCNGRHLCQACKTEGCNTIDLKKLKQDNDLIGMWQDLPLSCLTCNGEGCKGELVKCANTADKCVTIFDDNSKKVIERGCSTITNTEKCQRNPDFCFECKSNGCNDANVYTEFIDCIACTSQNQHDCVSLNSEKNFIKKCHKHCMTALYPLNDNSGTFNLIRTCLNDKESIEQEACLKDKDNSCKACKGDNCNNFDFPKDRIKCYHCENTETCKSPKSKVCQTYTTNGQCLAIYNSEKVESMGCAAEYKVEDRKKLFFENKLFECQGNECNSLKNLPIPNKCVLCNSKTNKNCAKDPENVKEKTTCEKVPNSFCYSRVTPDGDTERGCWSSLNLEERYNCEKGGDTTNCIPCKDPDSECNKKLFPEDRLQCHSCSSLEDPNCEDKPSNLKACLKYTAHDEACATTFIKGITLRGCKNEIECDDKNGLSCRSCTETGCNIANLKQMQYVNPTAFGIWQDLPLTCFVCTGKECEQESVPQAKCTSNSDSCVTILKNDGSGEVVRKGCSSTVKDSLNNNKNNNNVDYCKQNPEFCIACVSNSCNVGNSKSKYIDCFYCGLPDTPKCVEIDTNVTYSKRKCLGECMTVLQENSDNQSEPTYNLIRTCADDKDQKDKSKCVNGRDKNCASCTDHNCNTKLFPEDRRKCYSCSNSDSCKTPKSELCDLYRKNDDCYFFIYEKKILQMGCKSEYSDEDVENLFDLNLISTCNDDECNSLNNQPKEQECVACDSSNNADCAIHPESIKDTIKCPAPNNKCFSKIDKDGNTIRGCHYILGKEKKECKPDANEGCKSCNEPNCNSKIFPDNRRKCLICDSESDAECETSPQNSKICPLYKSDESCVTKYDKGKTERGCGQSIQCDSDDPKVCERCTTDNCNTVDIRKRNNSSLLVSNIFIITFAFMFSFFH